MINMDIMVKQPTQEQVLQIQKQETNVLQEKQNIVNSLLHIGNLAIQEEIKIVCTELDTLQIKKTELQTAINSFESLLKAKEKEIRNEVEDKIAVIKESQNTQLNQLGIDLQQGKVSNESYFAKSNQIQLNTKQEIENVKKLGLEYFDNFLYSHQITRLAKKALEKECQQNELNTNELSNVSDLIDKKKQQVTKLKRTNFNNELLPFEGILSREALLRIVKKKPNIQTQNFQAISKGLKSEEISIYITHFIRNLIVNTKYYKSQSEDNVAMEVNAKQGTLIKYSLYAITSGFEEMQTTFKSYPSLAEMVEILNKYEKEALTLTSNINWLLETSAETKRIN